MLINIAILSHISLEYRGNGHYCAFIDAITLKITYYITVTKPAVLMRINC